MSGNAERVASYQLRLFMHDKIPLPLPNEIDKDGDPSGQSGRTHTPGDPRSIEDFDWPTHYVRGLRQAKHTHLVTFGQWRTSTSQTHTFGIRGQWRTSPGQTHTFGDRGSIKNFD